jgi:hypothetical protein
MRSLWSPGEGETSVVPLKTYGVTGPAVGTRESMTADIDILVPTRDRPVELATTVVPETMNRSSPAWWRASLNAAADPDPLGAQARVAAR